jgi:hypothetical protein
MDCLSLLETSAGNKSLHFANATQLFTFNQIYGLHFWSEITNLMFSVIARKEYKNTILYLLTTIYHSSNTQRHLFTNKEDLHLSETASEFLLEPWLLIQVPWHPPVFYQWLIAALAELLKAKKELVEFYWWPVPKKLFNIVRKLLSSIETLHCRIMCGFRLINWLTNCNENSGSGYETNLHTVECILNMIILPSLPIIEFLVDYKFNILVRALRRMAWPSNDELTLEEELVASCCCSVEMDNFLPAFCLRTDDLGDATHLFGEIGSLQDIKDRLDKLPCYIAFVPMESIYYVEVGLTVFYFEIIVLLSENC